jgi:hypothetical protein
MAKGSTMVLTSPPKGSPLMGFGRSAPASTPVRLTGGVSLTRGPIYQRDCVELKCFSFYSYQEMLVNFGNS